MYIVPFKLNKILLWKQTWLRRLDESKQAGLVPCGVRFLKSRFKKTKTTLASIPNSNPHLSVPPHRVVDGSVSKGSSNGEDK